MKPTHPTPLPPPRSDGAVLHVDAERYVDTLTGLNNAGVRWLGEPWIKDAHGVTEVTRGFAFAGERCLHAATTARKQRAMIRVLARADAPDPGEATVVEFVFRPVRGKPVELSGWIVLQPCDGDMDRRTGITLIANGTADSGRYDIDVLEGGGRRPRRRRQVVTGLSQRRWTRFILMRRKGAPTVQLWAGAPGKERFAGAFADQDPATPILAARVGDDSSSAIAGSGHWDDIRVGGLLRRASDLRAGEPAPMLRFRRPKPVEPIPVGRPRQLFVDDWLIHQARGVKRRLHAIDKHPANPLIVPEHPWEGGAVLGGGAVFRDDSGKFRMYYKAYCPIYGPPPRQERRLKRSVTGFATSDDGIHWVKPMLGLHTFEGVEQTNIVIASRERDETEHELWEPWDAATGARSANSITWDPEEPDPEQRYKALVKVRGFSLLTSPDGIHWKDRGTLFAQAYDCTDTAFDPLRGVHFATAKLHYQKRRGRGYAESADGLNWSDTVFQMTVDGRDEEEDQIYGMNPFYYETVHLCLMRMYHLGKRHRLDIQLASARDPRHWDRTFREPLIPCGDRTRNEWDWANNTVISVPPVRVGDELWFYYSGRTADHLWRDHEGRKIHMMDDTWGRIGMGKLRLDGFVSAGAGERGGVLETKALELLNPHLYVNADARGGELRAEVTDLAGRPLPGYAAADCVPSARDSVRQRVRFRERNRLPASGAPVRLRFHLRDARLYSFWTQ